MALHLIDGDDAVLISEALHKLVDELVGDGDRSLMLETLSEVDYRTEQGDHNAARLIDAAQTPPLFTEKRVVVGRHLSRLAVKDQLDAITTLLEKLPDSTDLVMVWERGIDPKVSKMPALPRALKKAVEVAGGTLNSTAAPRGKAGSAWLQEHLETANLNFDRAAVRAIETLIGEDRSRVVGLLRTLEGALGSGSKVSVDDVASYAGDKVGRAVPWALDDAVDSGDTRTALRLLPRFIPYDGNLSERTDASFRLLAILHKRYANLLRLDGVGAISDVEAAELVGMKSSRSAFPAKKLLQQSRRLGFASLARAIELLAKADLQLRGTVDWPPELVIEVLVARLAALSRRAGR